MKEHSFFLQAAFPAGETGYRNKADWFRKQFESMLAQTVVLSDGMVRADVLQSKEIFTDPKFVFFSIIKLSSLK